MAVIDGITNSATLLHIGSAPSAIAVNTITNKIFVPNYADGTVTVIDGATLATRTITVGPNPNAVAINAITNKIYVCNYTDYLTAIDGATLATSNINLPSACGAVAVNEVTNASYASNGVLLLINGDSLTIQNISLPGWNIAEFHHSAAWRMWYSLGCPQLCPQPYRCTAWAAGLSHHMADWRRPAGGINHEFS